MKRIGFSYLLIFLLYVPELFSLNIVENKYPKIPTVISMTGNNYISYPFDIEIGRCNPFLNDSEFVLYSDRIAGIISNSDGLYAYYPTGYTGKIISRLLYGKIAGSNILGAYLIRNYTKKFSGKTGVTNFKTDSSDNYIIYQNVKWNNGILPLMLSFASYYNKDSLSYKIKFSGYSKNQFVDFEYMKNHLFLQFSSNAGRFGLMGKLNSYERLSDLEVFTPFYKSIFNTSDIGLIYDYYNRSISLGLSHTLRLDSKHLIKAGANYSLKNEFCGYLNFYGISPYIYSSIHYCFPSDSLTLSTISIFNERYFKGYFEGNIKYASSLTYKLISYDKLIWEIKDALFLNPGIKIEGDIDHIEVLPVLEMRFLDASLYTTYNLYWKRLSIIGKWDFYN